MTTTTAESNDRSDTVRIDAGDLTRLCRDLFVAVGMPLDDADLSKNPVHRALHELFDVRDA